MVERGVCEWGYSFTNFGKHLCMTELWEINENHRLHTVKRTKEDDC